MRSFLSKVVEDVIEKSSSLSGHCFVLPNKRSALFLKNELRKSLAPNSFLPAILSIEEFMERLSGYLVLDRIGLIFEFYSVFKEAPKKSELENFESFSKWAQILLQDFNELDGNLADADSILRYIYEARRVETWSVDGSEQSNLVQNYVSFHKLIPIYYQGLQKRMETLRAGYQGHVYKKACESLEDENLKLFASRFIFAGFNALSKSEEKVIQTLLERGIGSVYWDDDTFYELSQSSAGSFLSQYRKQWPYYRKNDFNWRENNIDSPKVIHFHGLPKNVSQIKHTGSLLKTLSSQCQMTNTALILGNEKLLPALLNSLPVEVSEANITMGYELQNVALSTFFESLFRVHINRAGRREKNAFYYRDLQRLFKDPNLKSHCLSDSVFQKKWNHLILKEKTLFLSEKDLFSLSKDESNLSRLFSLLFIDWDHDINLILKKISDIIEWLRSENDPDRMELEILFRFHTIFSQLLNFNQAYGHIDSLKGLHQFYRQILQMEKMSFQGEPLSGLQIMGLLESRVLDFENVILTSVNEGFLPTGRSDSSFIPLDIKAEKNLPTYREKEAIFSYHFFRLLHRAKRVYLIYNNITDDFGSGEPSRFLKQLEIAQKLGLLKNVILEKKNIQPELIQNPLQLKSIVKTPDVIGKLREISVNGFSPTALTTYIRNPLDYYKRYLLGIEEYKKVEENMAANTFGTVIHETLEAFYRPHLNQFLEVEHFDHMLDQVQQEVERQWSRAYSSSVIRTGKNYLSFEIAKQFIVSFIKIERTAVKKGQRIKILALEEKVSCRHRPLNFDFDIGLRGTIDRIDEVNGMRRIVDYKTGKVVSADMNIRDWEKLVSEEKHSKAFQVLMYAYMYTQSRSGEINLEEGLESGIISFKNLRSGFLKVNSEPVSRAVIDEFVIQLDKLLSEMFSADLAFEEKEIQAFSY